MAKVKLTEFDYAPGDKWSCGYLNLTAETPLGVFEWEEIVPGPRHSECSAECTAKLAGRELPDDLLDLHFEAPRKDGKWAKLFANSEEEVENTLQAWFEVSSPILEKFLNELTR